MIPDTKQSDVGNKTIAYYNISGGLDYEHELLKRWNLSNRITLRPITSRVLSDEDFLHEVHDAEGVVIEYFKISESLMDQLPRLRVIGLQSIGTDTVDLPAATRHHIAVTNAPGFCQQEVAATAVGMILDVARKITFYDRQVRQGSWEPLNGPIQHRLQGQTVGLVFFGGIPRLMAPILSALGLNVIAYAPTKSREFLADYAVGKVETLKELLEQSDFVSLHTPLIASTYHLIGERELASMKPTAFLINTSRGAVVDEQALVRAIREHVIAGAAVDVIEDVLNEQSELKTLENVVINPHAAFLSEESFLNAREMTLRGMVDLLADGIAPRYLVNEGYACEQ